MVHPAHRLSRDRGSGGESPLELPEDRCGKEEGACRGAGSACAREVNPASESSIALMLRSRASSAFTCVFDALWCGVSKHEAALILRDAAYAHWVSEGYIFQRGSSGRGRREHPCRPRLTRRTFAHPTSLSRSTARIEGARSSLSSFRKMQPGLRAALPAMCEANC